MNNVICGGCFNHLHIGHLFFFQKAKEKNNYLTVVLTHDKNNHKKNKVSFNLRLKNLKRVRIIDQILQGDSKDFKQALLKMHPQKIFLGFDQIIPPQVVNYIKKNQIFVKKVVKMPFYCKGKNKFLGQVFTGYGKAQYFMQKEKYQLKLKKLLQVDIFPGTLNLYMFNNNIKNLILRKSYAIKGFREGKKEIGGIKIFSVRLVVYPFVNKQGIKDGRKVDFTIKKKSTEAWIIIPDKTNYEDNVFEIAHPYKLRDFMNLRDGDYVEIEV